MGVQVARMGPELRLRALDLLLTIGGADAQGVAFLALQPDQQVERLQLIEDSEIDLPTLLNLCAPEFAEAWLAVFADEDSARLEGLGTNEGLSARMQARLFARAQLASPNVQAMLICDLANNPRLAPEVLVSVAQFMLNTDTDTDTEDGRCLLQRTDLPGSVIQALLEKFGLTDAVCNAVLAQQFASPAQLCQALAGRSDTHSSWREAQALAQADAVSWFEALSQAASARLREVAASNRATPKAAIERLLRDDDADVRLAACSHPDAPIERVADVLDAFGEAAIDLPLCLARPVEIWTCLAARQPFVGRRIEMLYQAAWERLNASRRMQTL